MIVVFWNSFLGCNGFRGFFKGFKAVFRCFFYEKFIKECLFQEFNLFVEVDMDFVNNVGDMNN